MNVIAIMNHMGVYFKEEPIRELHRALERDFHDHGELPGHAAAF